MSAASSATSIGCAVVNVDSGADGDDAGQLIRRQLIDAGHEVVHYAVVRDSGRQIKGELAIVAEKKTCRAIIFAGGTEIGPQPTTYDALLGMLDRRIDGFGELFRHVSFEQFGSKAIMARAAAGTYRGRIVISVPASPSLVQLAMEKLILPELRTMVERVSPKI